MVEILNYIDSVIADCVTPIKQYGLCHLLESDNQKYPATIATPVKKAVPDDRYNILMYHRLLNGSYFEREDVSFGKHPALENTQKVRTVVFVKIPQGDLVIDNIINSLPNNFYVTGYGSVFVNNTITLIRDRKAVWTDEYEKSYMDKYQQIFFVYAIEYDVNYIKCNVCV